MMGEVSNIHKTSKSSTKKYWKWFGYVSYFNVCFPHKLNKQETTGSYLNGQKIKIQHGEMQEIK